MTFRVACPSGHPVILTADKAGAEVACPHCLAVFRVEVDSLLRPHARKEDKARRARDDDEDEEDEKPQKKAKKPKAKARPADDDDEDEDEKPRKKRARKDDDEDDDDEDEDEEDEEEEEDEPIEWTPRKRQLRMCGIGLMIMMGAFCVLMLFSFVMMLALDYYTFEVMNYLAAKEKIEGAYTDSFEKFGYVAGPFVGLAQLVLLVGLFLSLFSVPPKVEGRGPIIGALVFGGLVFLAGILIIVYTSGATGTDEVRKNRMVQLMGGGAGLCFVLGLLAAMAYHGKLLHFLNLRMESSQPITNTLFYFLYFAGTFVLFLATPYICSYMFNFFGWGVLLGIDAVFALAIRQLIAQVKMFLLAKQAIDKYIREA